MYMKNKTYKESETLIMSDNMKKFLELVSKDENLKQKTLAFNDMEPEKAIRASIALAKELGIELSEADFAKEKSGDGLSDEELDAVAGGGGCGCPFGGYGEGTDYRGRSYTCACVGYGQGSDHCACPIVGGGTDEGM